MRQKIIQLFLLLSCLTAHIANAGWYQCYNYTGTIGDFPIILSLQIRPGYFGEQAKKHYNVIGVYQYEKYNNPIKLEGVIDLVTGKGELSELQGDKPVAKFAIEIKDKECIGIWTSNKTKKSLPFKLTHIATLVDTTASNEYYNVDILQANSLPQYYFIGSYAKQKGADRASMVQLKIINKKTNRLFQIIDFSKIATQTGNVATIIFDNVYVNQDKGKSFIVTNNVGRVGGHLRVSFNAKRNKFLLHPEPVIESPQ